MANKKKKKKKKNNNNNNNNNNNVKKNVRVETGFWVQKLHKGAALIGPNALTFAKIYEGHCSLRPRLF